MLIQLQNRSKSLIKYWIFVVVFNISLIIGTMMMFFIGVNEGGNSLLITNFAANISNVSTTLWIMLSIVLVMLAITISEFVLIIKCIKVCNKLLGLNPPMELREKVVQQRNKLQWIMFIDVIYLIIGTDPLLSLVAFVVSVVLKFLFWRDIENVK